jgi:hypothetical protein
MRRISLRSWLLDNSFKEYRIRQCLWIAIHNCRTSTWNLHYQLNPRGREFTKIQSPTLVHVDCVGKAVKTIAPDWVEVICEQINALQERLDLTTEKLESSSSKDHFENQWWIALSILSQLHLNLFFCCRVPGERLSDETIGFLSRADAVARDQVAHWRNRENFRFFAMEVIYLATIAQLRIEFGIINDHEGIGRTVDETLKLLEEVEVLFGTTLYEVDLGPTLSLFNMKSHMGSGMGIWHVGKLAIRLLHLAISMIGDKFLGDGHEENSTRRQKWRKQLWQWVQRAKARTLAQRVGLDNMVPDSMLVEIQRSLHNERASIEEGSKLSANQAGAPVNHPNGSKLADRLAAIELEEECEPPLELLPQARQILKDGNTTAPEKANKAIYGPFIQDLRRVSIISEKIKQCDIAQTEDKVKLQEELSQINQKIATKPGLQKLITIANFLNREEILQKNIEAKSDRFQSRIELQRLRQEMRREPVLERMFRIREGRPVSDHDLHKIAATRQGKVVFVDWFTITSFVGKARRRVYMLLWRNGICKGIDLGTEHGLLRAGVKKFFDVKDVYLPDVLPTPLEQMDLEEMAPSAEKTIREDDLKPILNCFELIKPLFDDPLVEPGDLLVLSLTEGFHNFPLHAIQEYEDDEVGPLILNHPVVYVPSLSVLHKCFWSRYVPSSVHKPNRIKELRSLVLGGIVSPDPVFQYGVKAVNKIGGVLNSPKTTFVGDDATMDNFLTHISSSDVLHIHLHTNYGDKKSAKNSGHGHLSQNDAEDVTFVNSPLDQAILFNGAKSNNKLTAARIIELQLSKGAHFSLMACASGRQGTHIGGLNRRTQARDVITDEVMGLVPAFLFSGAGSVTSTLWPIMDEHGAVFSNHFFRAFVEARKKARAQLTSGEEGLSWIDLAEIHQKAVLEMRRIYKQPSAWAGFVLSGCWNFLV